MTASRRNVFILPLTESTNTLARQLAMRQRLRHGDVVWAHRQIRGRGRRGQWHSPPGGLYATWLFKPRLKAERAEEWMQRIANAVHQTISKLLRASCPVHIKPPNDIFIRSSKVAGILIENQIRSHLIETSLVGIGINVHSCPFPPFPEYNATSLRTFTTRPLHLRYVFQLLDSHLLYWIHTPLPPQPYFLSHQIKTGTS